MKKINGFATLGIAVTFAVALLACSCTINRAVTTSGRATIITTDTTTIIHGGGVTFTSKY